MVKIIILPEALADLILAIQLCPVEISGLGKVKPIGENFLIEEIYVFKQRCSEPKTVFNSQARGQFLHEMMKSGKGEEINSFNLWWHSHVCSDAEWSGTDRNNIEEFRPPNGADYLISIVGNKSNIITVRLDYFQPERLI